MTDIMVKQIPLASKTTLDTDLVVLPHGITQPPVVQLPILAGVMAGSQPALLRTF